MKSILTVFAFIVFFNLNAQNTVTGTGASNSGNLNTIYGYYAGDVNTSSNNSFFGNQSGKSNTTGGLNTFIGSSSGYSNISGSQNLFIGSSSGYSVTNSNYNVFVGNDAGYGLNGDYNTFIGCLAARYLKTGTHNVGLGYYTGAGNGVSGSPSYNTYIGDYSGSSNGTGSNNVFLGYKAGYSSNGSGNIFLGYNAGYNDTGSNRLYIDNSNTTTPLIYGDFNANQIGINALPNTTHTLTIGGTIHADGVFVNGVAISGNIGNWAQVGTNLYNVLSDKVGIGTSTPTQKLDVNGNINASGILINGIPFAGGGSQWTTSAGTPNIYFTGAGVVSIGTTTAPLGYKLAIGGKAIAEEIVIKLQPWPDYVFKNTYHLKPLSEVEIFIKENGHLPGIHSAKEIEENGLAIGEINASLMEKIEELTLYAIEQNKIIKKQDALIKEQANNMKEIEYKLNELTKGLTNKSIH